MDINSLEEKKKKLLEYVKEFFKRVDLDDNKRKKVFRIIKKLVNVGYTTEQFDSIFKNKYLSEEFWNLHDKFYWHVKEKIITYNK